LDPIYRAACRRKVRRALILSNASAVDRSCRLTSVYRLPRRTVNGSFHTAARL